MCDNYYNKKNGYCECPPKMGLFREVGNYSPNSYMNQSIAHMNKIRRDDDYKTFLQMNGKVIADNEWKYLRQNYSCWVNECAFTNKRYAVHPMYQIKEMQRNNKLLTGKHQTYQCKNYPDSRMVNQEKIN